MIHLVLIPSPEEVNRAILSPLDNGPATFSFAVFTPGLQQMVGVAWTQQVDATGLLS